MDKFDMRRALGDLYRPPADRFVEVDVPAIDYLMVDGAGDPNRDASYAAALEWLYSVSYPMKFATKASLGRDYVVPPLEGLWWADDPADFVARRKDRWRWTMMIAVPGFVERRAFDTAVDKARGKLGEQPPTFRWETLEEGRCLQRLHVGSFDDEGPVLAELHDELMPRLGLTFAGRHHEIYLSDPRRVPEAKRKTILRQPVVTARG